MISEIGYTMRIPIWMHPSIFLGNAEGNGFLLACEALDISISFDSDYSGDFGLILSGSALIVLSLSYALNELGIQTPNYNSIQIPEA